MSIDVNQALNHPFTPTQSSYTERDTSLYALSIGAADDPTDSDDLQFVYELSGKGHKALPTMAVTFPFKLLPQLFEIPGFVINPMMIVHGEQYFELKRPLPTAATFTNHAKISHVYDKGSGALMIIEAHTLCIKQRKEKWRKNDLEQEESSQKVNQPAKKVCCANPINGLCLNVSFPPNGKTPCN